MYDVRVVRVCQSAKVAAVRRVVGRDPEIRVLHSYCRTENRWEICGENLTFFPRNSHLLSSFSPQLAHINIFSTFGLDFS